MKTARGKKEREREGERLPSNDLKIGPTVDFLEKKK